MKIYFQTFKEKWTRPPKHQFPTQMAVFKNPQGDGKTLSMVQHALQVKKEFPECEVFSNVKLNVKFKYNYYQSIEGLRKALNFCNGQKGVLILIDEAHLYMGKKTGIPLDFLTTISQQRKDRRRILMTSQIWESLDVDTRKQVKDIVSCNMIFSNFFPIQVNKWYIGKTLKYNKQTNDYEAELDHTEVFHHNNNLYSTYDTFQKITPQDTNENYNRPLSQNNKILNNQVSISVKR